jgi:hypothetical protein
VGGGVKVERKIKDSIVYRSEPISIELDADPEDQIHMLRDALDVATDRGTDQILDAGAVGRIPCCSNCGEFKLIKPSRAAHRSRKVRLQNPLETAAKKRGTCADLCIYNAALKNAKHAMGETQSTAAVELLPDELGPGSHHAIVISSCGKVSDPGAPPQADGKCPICS